MAVPAALALSLLAAPSARAGDHHVPGPPQYGAAPEATARSGQGAEATETEALSPQRTRFYIGLRAGPQFFLDTDLAPGVDIDSGSKEPAGSGVIGVNIGRYLGLEIAADFYESDLDAPGFGKIGEYTVWTAIPQVRLRYPMLDDRLAPYLFGGAGLGVSEFSDKTAAKSDPAAPQFKGKDSNLVYAWGGGLDYFIADNIALNAELKYVSHKADAELGSRDVEVDLDSLLLLGGLRLFFPGPPREITGPGARRIRPDDWYARVYLDFRVGYPFVIDEDIVTGFKFTSDDIEQVMGASIGLDLHRHFGLELAVDHYEMSLQTTPAGGAVSSDTKIGEYDVWSFVPQLRFRYPLLDDTLAPYLLAGAGVSRTEVNDRVPHDPSAGVPRFSAKETNLIASIGAGLEYFVSDNMALGAQARYVYHRPEVEIDGAGRTINADMLLLTANLRIYFN